MLLNLHKRGWTEGLKMRDHSEMKESNEKAIKVSLPTSKTIIYMCSAGTSR